MRRVLLVLSGIALAACTAGDGEAGGVDTTVPDHYEVSLPDGEYLFCSRGGDFEETDFDHADPPEVLDATAEEAVRRFEAGGEVSFVTEPAEVNADLDGRAYYDVVSDDGEFLEARIVAEQVGDGWVVSSMYRCLSTAG